jgi:rhodanese-related sulfurtransferase
MQSDLHLTYASAPDGAVTLDIATDAGGRPEGPVVTVIWDHGQALDAAAAILTAAGVTRAEFFNGILHQTGPSIYSSEAG